MTCQYCRKKTSDMPEHLAISKRCQEKHEKRLRMAMAVLLAKDHRERDAAMKEYSKEGL